MTISRLDSMCLAGALVLASCLPAQQQPGAAAGRAKIGDKVPDFSMATFVLNGDGRQQLSDFYGYPILFDFWGTH